MCGSRIAVPDSADPSLIRRASCYSIITTPARHTVADRRAYLDADPQISGAVRLASWAGFNLSGIDIGNMNERAG